MPGAPRYDGGLTISTQVSSLDKAIDWYTNVLGMKLLYRVDHIGWAEVASPVTRVNVGLSQVDRPKVGAGPVPTWGVQDIDNARATLESHKVRFDGDTITIEGMVRLATFFDPDGNAHMLYQSLARQ
ncbi:MAG: VOC family protein [Phycisphaeraceae bacterium]|nr:VOC family protein [Phycisphaeraceae bacterium]